MMKRRIKLLSILVALTGLFMACEKTPLPFEEDNNQSERTSFSFISDSVYYVVGYHVSSGVLYSHDGTAKSGGYLFISKNLKDTLHASNQNIVEDRYYGIGNLLDSIFTFPAEIMPNNVCEYNFFPQEYRFVYQVQLTCRLMTKEEELDAHPACHTLYPVLYPYLHPKCVVISSISKIL